MSFDSGISYAEKKIIHTITKPSVALKAGISFNKNSKFVIPNIFPTPIKSSISNSPAMAIDIIFPFTQKLSALISGNFISEHNVKSLGPTNISSDYHLRSTVTSYGLMGGLRYELYRYHRFSQYVSGSIGMMLNKIGTSVLDVEEQRTRYNFFQASKLNFAWQIATGIKYAISKRFSLGLEYAYLNKGKAATKMGSDLDLQTGRVAILKTKESSVKFKNLISHQVMLGFEFTI